MINYNIIPQVICKMWNLRECSACSKCNVTMQATAVICKQFKWKVCLMLAIYTLPDLFPQCPKCFPRWIWTSLFKIFFGRKSLFQLFIVVVYFTFWQE